MAWTLIDTGFMTVTVRHLTQKGETWFYNRRVPEELRAHYGNKRHIRKSLGKDRAVAVRRAASLAAMHDAEWRNMRSSEGQNCGITTRENREAALGLLETVGLSRGDGQRDASYVADVLDRHFERRYADYSEARHGDGWEHDPERWQALLSQAEREAVKLAMEDPRAPRVFLTDALDVYLREHKNAEDPKFARDTRRAIDHVIASAGDLLISDYRREHAKSVRDHLLKTKGKTGTVRRQLNRIKAVFNVGLREFDLGAVKNPFEKLAITGEAEDAEDRLPFTAEELNAVMEACRVRDDDMRHIVALQADTGARLGEIVGLRLEDVTVNGGGVPHVFIREHKSLGRTLKTAASERKVPLVGVALWAALRAVEASSKAGGGSGWLFPRYASDGVIKATHAANTINKWLRKVTGTDKTSHSFRHAMRDRLREAGAPEDIQDALGGWGSRTVGEGYGEGYQLKRLQGFMLKIVLGAGCEGTAGDNSSGEGAAGDRQ